MADLRLLAEKHRFLIFEDRKFADEFAVVQKQYRDGLYRILDWADITSAYLTPGPDIIIALAELGVARQRGLLLAWQPLVIFAHRIMCRHALSLLNCVKTFSWGLLPSAV